MTEENNLELFENLNQLGLQLMEYGDTVNIIVKFNGLHATVHGDDYIKYAATIRMYEGFTSGVYALLLGVFKRDYEKSASRIKDAVNDVVRIRGVDDDVYDVTVQQGIPGISDDIFTIFSDKVKFIFGGNTFKAVEFHV